MRITDEYAGLNRQLHESNPNFGRGGSKWARNVEDIALLMNSTSILDYGCGKGTLAASLPLPIREYDPAIPGKDAEPHPADFVVCTDVLEHVEPECVETVLDHIQALARRVTLLTIHCGPASKSLPDGRNAHILQRPVPWWVERINQRFVISQMQMIGQFTIWIAARSMAEHERILAEGIKA